MYTYVQNEYKKNNKKNVLNKLVLIVLLLAIVLMISIITTNGSYAVKYKTIIVKEGDTLWNIVKNKNYYEKDPRILINEIKKVNNLNSVILQPGQKIKIPT
ncbi:MAG: LysM peptidoglycan-binding domain-containing protein [bacterium]